MWNNKYNIDPPFHKSLLYGFYRWIRLQLIKTIRKTKKYVRI